MHFDTHARGRQATAARDVERSDDPNLGRLLDGRYLIRGRIARGGMATVYEAHDVRLDRTVAIKVMHPGLGDATSGDEAFAARFVREARAAARLSHPNVVQVYDQGEDGGTVFLAMELVPGHTLRDAIAEEAPMPPERALALLEPVLAALAEAHRAGLVHRDVKPENVLIATEPDSGASRVKVADFGLAKAVSADTQHTATGGVLIGTVSYLAPELVVDGTADARADVYAAGVILYELLTGWKPHTGETPIQVAYRHVHHDVPPPSELAPGIPAYVDALVARATARDRSLRPADAGVLLHQAHRVAQALRDGARDDPDLYDDLMPTVREDTTPEPVEALWDAAGVADLREPADVVRREPTTTLEPAPAPPRRTPPSRPVPHAAPAPHAPRRRRGLVLLLLAGLVAGLVGGGAYWFGWARYTTTPGVIGLERAAAVDKLEAAGLSVELAEPAYSESVPKGEVISTQPEPGARILPDDEVLVVVSRGPERYDVPDLRGLTVDRAAERLAGVKMIVGQTKERYSETVPEGEVITTSPRFGTKAARRLPVDTAVDLVVSLGRRPIEVRSFVGKGLDRVTAWADRRGLDVEVTGEEHSDTVPEGAVISQEPADGTLFKGDQVEVVVSLGPEMVEVPSVWREFTDDAIEELESLGFKVVTAEAPIHLGLGYAANTDPPAGTMVRKGSTITLYVV